MKLHSASKTATILALVMAFTSCVHAQQVQLGGNLQVGGKTSIQANSTPQCQITTGSCPGGTLGSTYQCTLTTNNCIGSVSWSKTAGSLPGGLTLSGNTISGTPTAPAGVFNFTVEAADSATTPDTPTQSLSISVGCPSLGILAPTQLPNALEGAAYSTPFSQTGGVSTFTWSTNPSGTICNGLSINSSTGIFSGTPTQAGTCMFSVIVADSCNLGSQTAMQNETLLINSNIAVVPVSAPFTATAGVLFQTTITATGGTPAASGYVFSLATGSTLPLGLNLNANGQLSGTVNIDGTFNFSIIATDSLNNSSQPQPFSLIVTSAPIVFLTQSPLPTCTQGQAFGPLQMNASGGFGLLSWTAPGLTAIGLSVTSSGVVSGTCSQVGTFNPIFTVTDQSSPTAQTAQQAYQLIMKANIPPLTFADTTMAQATAGVPYSGPITLTGGTSPYKCVQTGGTLQSAFTVNSNCTITGTPTLDETDNPTVQATDSGSPALQATATLSLTTVAPAISCSTSSLAPAKEGSAYSAQVNCSGGYGALSLSQTGLPTGLVMSASGAISGTPTESGTFGIAVTATDQSAPTPQTFPLNLTLQVNTNVAISSPATLPQGQVGIAYNVTLTGQGGNPPYSWASGTLPGGLSLSGAVISGTPTTAGTYQFTVTLTDSASNSVTQTETLVIAPVSNAPQPPDPNLLTWNTTLSGTPSPGTVRCVGSPGVSCGASYATIQLALAAASCGDIIVLPNTAPAVTLTATLTISNVCTNTDWLRITRDTSDATFPAEGTRVDPCYVGIAHSVMPWYPYPTSDTQTSCGRHMPQILENGSGAGINITGKYIRFVGIEVTRSNAFDLSSGLITLNNSAACTAPDTTCMNAQPDHVIFDRMLVHGDAQRQTTRAYGLSGSRWDAILDNYIYDVGLYYAGGGGDAQCWAGGFGQNFTGVGEWKFSNNQCSASTMGQLFGGSFVQPVSPTTTFDGVPHDVWLFQNWFYKPLIWDTQVGQTNDVSVTNEGITYPPVGAQEITVQPTAVQVAVNGTYNFNTTFLNDSAGGTNRTNGTVTLSCGGGTCGTIVMNGEHAVGASQNQVNYTYTAPAAVPPATVTLTFTNTVTDDRAATLGKNLNLVATATVTIVASSPTHSVSVWPAAPDLNIQPSYSDANGNTRQFCLQFASQANYSTTFTWAVDGVNSGNSNVGTVDSTGFYCSPTGTVTPAAATGNFYVSTTGSDSNDGTTPTTGGGHGPWLTIGHAASTVTTAGSVVVIENGTYPEQVTFNHSGSPGSQITFIAQNKWGAIVAPSSSGQIFSVNGSYVTFENLVLQGNSSGTNNDGIKFQSPGTGGQAIGNEIHNIGTGNCSGGAPIISAQGSTLISGNFIYDYGEAGCNQYEGIYLNDGNNQTVINNLIVEGAGGSTSATIGIQVNGQEALVTNFPSNEDVSNNTIVNMTSWCSLWASWTGTASGDNFNNNICYNTGLNGTSGSLRTANNGGGFSGDSFANNLINSSGSSSLATGTALTNTVTTAPAFVKYTGDQTGNYHPASGSPAIGAGTSTGAPSTDFDGITRLAPIWIGAYQNTGSPTHTITATAADSVVGSSNIMVSSSAPIRNFDLKAMTSKNGWELKEGSRILFDTFYIENAWGAQGNGGGQQGYCVLIQTLNQNAQNLDGNGNNVGYGPEHTNDVQIQNGLCQNVGVPFVVTGGQFSGGFGSLGTHRVYTQNVICDNCNYVNQGHGFTTVYANTAVAGAANTSVLPWTSATAPYIDNVLFRHVTFVGGPNANTNAFAITNNLAQFKLIGLTLQDSFFAAPGGATFINPQGEAGDCDSATGSGAKNTEANALVPCWNPYTFNHIALLDSTAQPTVFTSSPIWQPLATTVGFVNYKNGQGGDYRLCTGNGTPAASCTAASIYIGGGSRQASDGSNVGADANGISVIQTNIRTGVRTP